MQRPGAQRSEVVVVDDNDVNRLLVSRQLERLGYRVRALAGGRGAAEVATGPGVALVLLDCRMPDVDGFTVARAIRAREAETGGRRVPIVAVTADHEVDARTRCLDAGMDDFLAKPLLLDELRRTLERWIGGGGWDDEYPVDLGLLAQLTAELGQPGTVHALVQTYQTQLPRRLDALRRAIVAADDDALVVAASELRGASAALGCTAVVAACEGLEDRARRAAGGLDLIAALMHAAEATERSLLATVSEA